MSLNNFVRFSGSHPVWVRGLKHEPQERQKYLHMSHPVWVRGLKLCTLFVEVLTLASHPVWVRGLKLHNRLHYYHKEGVAPRVGAWIETLLTCCGNCIRLVAPRVGAWIETLRSWRKSIIFASRTPCGCVD